MNRRVIIKRRENNAGRQSGKYFILYMHDHSYQKERFALLNYDNLVDIRKQIDTLIGKEEEN